jgi:hypothetical protein
MTLTVARTVRYRQAGFIHGEVDTCSDCRGVAGFGPPLATQTFRSLPVHRLPLNDTTPPAAERSPAYTANCGEHRRRHSFQIAGEPFAMWVNRCKSVQIGRYYQHLYIHYPFWANCGAMVAP